MIKQLIKVDSKVTLGERCNAICPNCKRVTALERIDTKTGLYYMFIRRRSLHDRKFYLCTECKNCFEVDE